MAYTTQNELETWRQKMLQKYGGLARPNGRVLPVGGSFDEGGVRYTGAGPNDFIERSEPAGIVHEGEMVIEEPAVRRAGGPGAVRKEIEGLRGAEKSGMPGYAAGTGSGTVNWSSNPLAGIDLSKLSTQNMPSMEDINKTVAGVNAANPPASTTPAPTTIDSSLTRDSLFKSIAKAGGDLASKGTMTGVGTMTPSTGGNIPTEGVPTEGVSRPTAITGPGELITGTDKEGEGEGKGIDYEALSREGIEGIRDIAGGKSEAARLARERSQAALAGEQAAERIARRQEMAQAGEEGGTVAAAMARLGREERLAKTALEGELATKEAERAEQAQYKLADIGTSMMLAMKELGFKEESMDIAWERLGIDKDQAEFLKTQWGDKMKMWGDEFQRDSDQWGEEYALRKLATNWDMQEPVLNMMLENGQFEGASKILENFGFGDIDFSGIEDEYSRDQVAKGSIALTSILTENPAAGLENPEVRGELERIYNNLAVKPEDKEAWMAEKVEAIKIATSPFGSAMAAYSDEDLSTYAMSFGWTEDTPFEFAGYTGNEAVRLALTSSMMPGGGMVFNADGTMSLSPNSAIAQLMAGPEGVNIPKVEGEEGVTRTPDQILADKQAFVDKVNTGALPTADDISKNVQTVNLSSIPTGEGVTKWLETHAESNPGGWINVDGQGFKIDTGKSYYTWLTGTDGKEYTLDNAGNWYAGHVDYPIVAGIGNVKPTVSTDWKPPVTT